jgi:hypothetical protein
LFSRGIAEAAQAARQRLAATSKYVILERLLSMGASSVPHSNARRAGRIYGLGLGDGVHEKVNAQRKPAGQYSSSLKATAQSPGRKQKVVQAC